MNTNELLKTGGTLAGLSFISSLIISLFIAFSVSSIGFRIVAGIILLAIAGALIFLAFFKADDKTPKAAYIFVGVFSIIAGFIWFFISSDFHKKDAYLNRFVVYTIFAAALCAGIHSFYTFISRRIYGALLAATSFDVAQEHLLYVILGLLYGLLVSLCAAAGRGVGQVITYTIGIWFLNAIIGFAIGFVLVHKSGNQGPSSMAAPVSHGSDYDAME